MLVPEPELIFPKFTLPSGAEFYHGFDPAKIPFFEDFQIMAVDDYTEDGVKNVCYAGATSLTGALSIAALAATFVNLLA